MRNGIILSAVTAACGLALQAAPAAAAPGGCAAAIKAVPVKACVETSHGVALADSDAEAAALAEHGRAAEARFEKHFGRKAAPYALLTSEKQTDLGPLKALDYTVSYRWETDAQYDESMLSSLKSNIQKMVAERGLSKEQADQIYNQSLDRHAKRVESGERNKSKGSVIPRQIGQASLVHAFWPQATAQSSSAAPDWLKEVAGTLVEDDAAANQKREQFKGGYQGKGWDPMTFLLSSEQLMNLTDLLTKPRPQGPTSTGSGTSVQVMQVRGAGPSPIAASISYPVQARVFADYMVERTAQPAVFGNIATAMSGGQTLEQWLAGEGAGLGLPGSIAALEADWKAWLLKKFGKPG
jgi:hypothetical protein